MSDLRFAFRQLRKSPGRGAADEVAVLVQVPAQDHGARLAYLVNVDGSNLERVTWADGFASFPMFTRDGKRLVFCGSRGATSPRGLDVFTADWESF